LKIKNVVIPIYLSKEWVTYQLIYDFIEQIWSPLCNVLATRKNKDYWLKLFIIDNEVEDEDNRDYHVEDIQESIQTFTPYKLKKVAISSTEFKTWLEDGKVMSERVFYKFESQCKAFLCQFELEEHYISYMPACCTIENLFNKICTDIPNNLINLTLKELIEQHAER